MRLSPFVNYNSQNYSHSFILYSALFLQRLGLRWIFCQLSSLEFYFYSTGFFLSLQVSVSTFSKTTRQQIIIIAATRGAQAATTQETLSSPHLLFALVRYFPAVAQSRRRALVKAN